MKPIFLKNRILYFAFCIALLGQISTAQIFIGPSAGVNWGIFKVENQSEGVSNSSRIGVAIGVIADFPLDKIFSIRVEPSYIQKGTEITAQPTINKFHFGYLQVPIEAKVSIPTSIVNVHIIVGPNIGYLLSAKFQSTDFAQELDIKDGYKNYDFALDAGVGLDYPVSPMVKAGIDIKYSLGLVNIDKGTAGAINTRGFQLMAGILFAI